jgi:hypothetical protein
MSIEVKPLHDIRLNSTLRTVETGLNLERVQQSTLRSRLGQLGSKPFPQQFALFSPAPCSTRTPGVEDEYEWKPLPGMENLYNEGLFTKQLSKHSLGAYMELYRGLGVSFRAALMVLCKLCVSANVPASPAAATGQKLPSPRGSMPCSWKMQDLLMSSTLGRHRLKYILKREKAQREE